MGSDLRPLVPWPASTDPTRPGRVARPWPEGLLCVVVACRMRAWRPDLARFYRLTAIALNGHLANPKIARWAMGVARSAREREGPGSALDRSCPVRLRLSLWRNYISGITPLGFEGCVMANDKSPGDRVGLGSVGPKRTPIGETPDASPMWLRGDSEVARVRRPQLARSNGGPHEYANHTPEADRHHRPDGRGLP